MADQVYNQVTQALFGCVKQQSNKEHGTVYDPPNGNSGTATTPSPKVVLTFDFVPADMTLSYTLVEKPWWVPESAIWDGIAKTLNHCRGKIVAANKQKLTAPAQS